MRFLGFALTIIFLGLPAETTAKPVSFVCEFETQKMTLTFVFDDGAFKSTARVAPATMVGNQGTAEVLALPGSVALSFVEPLDTGAVQTTTIKLATGEAIHSRHTLMGFGAEARFIPSQSKGTCVLRN